MFDFDVVFAEAVAGREAYRGVEAAAVTRGAILLGVTFVMVLVPPYKGVVHAYREGEFVVDQTLREAEAVILRDGGVGVTE